MNIDIGDLVACQPYGDESWVLAKVVRGPFHHQNDEGNYDPDTWAVEIVIAPDGELTGGECQLSEENLWLVHKQPASDMTLDSRLPIALVNCKYYLEKFGEVLKFLEGIPACLPNTENRW